MEGHNQIIRASLHVTYVGHGTVLLEMDGVRILTDPVLRHRVGPLRRLAPDPGPAVRENLDAVLISHFHLDHFDPPSLRLLDRRTPLLVPPGGVAAVRRLGFRFVEEMRPGRALRLGAVRLAATKAAHYGERTPGHPVVDSLGFIVEGGHQVYFAGDTALFPEMIHIGERLDLALLPVWGWGPRLGEEHLTPLDAARSLTLLEPRVAIPIHWGTFHPLGLGWTRPAFLVEPPYTFLHHAARLAPDVAVHVIPPGGLDVL